MSYDLGAFPRPPGRTAREFVDPTGAASIFTDISGRTDEIAVTPPPRRPWWKIWG